jgi:acetyltransferase-like isoleucine patch superfamily enzyme
MLDRPDPSDSFYNRARDRGRNAAGIVVRKAWDLTQRYGGIGPTSRAARQFGAFGHHSVICFPYEAIVNEYAISIGSYTIIGKGTVLSAGWGPGHEGLPPDLVRIGDRCLIGRGSSIVGHGSIVLEDDVWTGQQVHLTDMNHGYVNLDLPISQQADPDAPIRIGAGSWLGHGVVVLPGVHVGKHTVIGAGSVVTHDIPDYAVAAGIPARVLRRYDDELGWLDIDRDGLPVRLSENGSPGLANRLRPFTHGGVPLPAGDGTHRATGHGADVATDEPDEPVAV